MAIDLGVIGRHGIAYYRHAFGEDEIQSMKQAMIEHTEEFYPNDDRMPFRSIRDYESVFSSSREYGMSISLVESALRETAEDIDSLDFEPETDWPKRVLKPEFPGLGFFEPLDVDSTYNTKLVHEDEDFMISIPNEGERPFFNFEFKDFEELLMYQLTLKRNLENLSDRGLSTPDSDIVISSYLGDPYPLLLTDYKSDFVNGADMFGEETAFDNLPIGYTEQQIDEIISSMVEKAELAAQWPYDHKKPRNIGFSPDAQEYLFWDQGELSRQMSESFPYETIEDFWNSEGIEDEARGFMNEAGISNYQY